jgi:hypothetical protein
MELLASGYGYVPLVKEAEPLDDHSVASQRSTATKTDDPKGVEASFLERREIAW